MSNKPIDSSVLEEMITLQTTILEIEALRTSRAKVLEKIDSILTGLKETGANTSLWEGVRKRINADPNSIS